MTDTEKTLEQRVLELETKPRRMDMEMMIAIAGLKRNIAALFDLMGSHKKWSEAESDLLAATRREVIKLSEAYYHVFPERLATDALGDQPSGGDAKSGA